MIVCTRCCFPSLNYVHCLCRGKERRHQHSLANSSSNDNTTSADAMDYVDDANVSRPASHQCQGPHWWSRFAHQVITSSALCSPLTISMDGMDGWTWSMPTSYVAPHCCRHIHIILRGLFLFPDLVLSFRAYHHPT